MGVSRAGNYHEPANARAPERSAPWRLYIFRKGNPLASPGRDCFIRLDRQRYYLFGRDGAICHVAMAHASVSKQHAVIQFRQRVSGDEADEGDVVPWLLDLKSRNGTYLNDVRVPSDVFMRIHCGDTLLYGASTREWVLVQEAHAGVDVDEDAEDDEFALSESLPSGEL
eukprot:Plantae.Rhodophyta-Palmaria_palmata.ctg17.p1 GENE.Plantae.Rhodophyta-Palmaria_palmata.ctg17~~Plantae.Rhodophyta-Palmaria_palmata.ctg17.p1  ORF type:complete len:178 (+),score=30.81 Plantae.Rhodophyta-Palmaria_palmata.ctg17:30-536(+)